MRKWSCRGWGRKWRRPGRPCTISPETVEKVITGAVSGGQVSSCRRMARATGISPSTVQRIWARNDTKPHATRTFKLSKDIHFAEKFWDVIGLYLDPPERALVLCCDERESNSGIGANTAGIALGSWSYTNSNSRLLPAWNNHSFCRIKLPGRENNFAYRRTSPAYRMAAFPTSDVAPGT